MNTPTTQTKFERGNADELNARAVEELTEGSLDIAKWLLENQMQRAGTNGDRDVREDQAEYERKAKTLAALVLGGHLQDERKFLAPSVPRAQLVRVCSPAMRELAGALEGHAGIDPTGLLEYVRCAEVLAECVLGVEVSTVVSATASTAIVELNADELDALLEECCSDLPLCRKLERARAEVTS